MRLLHAARARWPEAVNRRTLLQASLSLALVLGFAWLIVMRGARSGDGYATDALREGQQAPDFVVETLTGASFALDGARGRPVWISFWASWCPPCRGEIPDIEAVRGQAGDRLEFIAINMDEPRSAITAYMSTSAYQFPVGVDPAGEVSRRYRVVGLPTHVFVAADGTVAQIRVGGMSRKAMSEAVDAVLSGKRGPADDSAVAATELGAALYNAQCLRCHGDSDGKGGAPSVPPHTDEGHTWHHSDLHLTAVIMRGGGERQGMPAFGSRLTSEEVRAILSYLKTWWGDEQREFQSRMSTEGELGSR